MKNKKEFEWVFRRGRRWRGPDFEFIAADNGLSHSRLGLVVGRKAGKAVQRARLKRFIREVFRTFRPLGDEKIDLVVRALPGAGAKVTFNSVQRLFHQYHLWRKNKAKKAQRPEGTS